jgi:hypothetical protein
VTVSQPWHTEGYLKLANACMYLALDAAQGHWTDAELDAAYRVLIACGTKIRREHDHEMS